MNLTEIGIEIKAIATKTGEMAIALGNLLIEAKHICPKGQWLSFLNEYFPYSARQAQRFMEIAADFEDLENSDRYQPTALSKLAGESEELKSHIAELAEVGELITPKLVDEVIESYKNPEEFLRSDVDLADLRHKTAMSRNDLSLPAKLALKSGAIAPGLSHLDYGCGKAGDVIRLRQKGIDSRGYDPFYFPYTPLISADVVSCCYVVNVIESEKERQQVVEKAWSLAKKSLIVAIRTDDRPSVVLPYGDGHIVANGCFQKHYSQTEAKEFLENTIQIEPQVLGDGVFLLSN